VTGRRILIELNKQVVRVSAWSKNTEGENEPMKTSHKWTPAVLNPWKFKGRTVCGIALVSFVAGSFLAARLTHMNQVLADSNRAFELRVYHAVPGKLTALESRFRDTTSKLLAKHHLNVVGYWVPQEAPAWDNTFIFMLAHPSREEAKKNWDAMRADPAFQETVKSEQADKLVEKIDWTYMHPTDFSPMK
jgi:NIPSNAP